MTKPSLLSSLLLFGVSTTKSSTTAADQRQPQQARFGRSMHTHSSATPPLQRIREVNTVMSPKATLRIIDEPTTLRHRRKLTSKPPMFSDVLDAELEAMSLSMSMSLPSSFDFDGDVDMPSIITTDPISAVTPSSSPVTTTLPPTSEHSDETHYVKIMFEYLSECAGLELDTDACLVSSTIDEMLTFQMDMGRRRFLQTRTLQSSNDCAPPPMTDQIMGSIMMLAISNGQCPGISADEYNTVFDTFMGVFAATECWESLCNPGASTELLFRILFEDAAQCAGVELDVHECVYDNIIETFAMTNALPVRHLRRVLEHDSGESYPCTGPSETEMNSFVSNLLNDAKDKCIASGVELESSSTYWASVSSDLVTVFSSPTCSGVTCEVEEESTVPLVAESIVEGEVRSIHVPSTTTTTPDLPTDGEDVPTFDDPTIDAKHDNVIVGDKSKVHNAVFIAVAAGGLVAIAALLVGLRRRRSSRTTTEKEDIVSVDGTSTDGSSACNDTADLSSPMSSTV